VIILAITEISNPPDALRFFRASRERGYELNQAVTELIDNSITAGAKKIKIDFYRLQDTQNFVFLIADDGNGMDRQGITNAMKFGSDESDNPEDLGKYGMGLKDASLSQCRKFTVFSIKKNEMNRRKFYGGCWDIDHIQKRKDFKMIGLDYSEITKNKLIKNDYFKNFNTIILWENIDKIDGTLENTERPGRIVGTKTGRLETFIRMTFHRFLDGSLGNKKKIVIILNDRYLKAWDPFCSHEKNTDTRKKIPFKLHELPNSSDILIEPYILPTKDGKFKFSSIEAWKDAKGLLSWNDSQGLYIYRENRLVQYGGWLGTREKDEHIKYARIAISFKKQHDGPFGISVTKTKITLPDSLHEFLKYNKDIKKVIGDAKARGGTDKEAVKTVAPLLKEQPGEGHPHDSVTHESQYNSAQTDLVNLIETQGKKPAQGNSTERTQLKNPKFICNSNFHGNRSWLWDCQTTLNNEMMISFNEKHPFFKYCASNISDKEQLLSVLRVLICAFVQSELDLNNGWGIHQKEKIEKISQNLVKIIQQKDTVI